MLTREQIEQLETFDGGGAGVLSVYLDLDAARQVRRSYRIVFENLLRETREHLAEPARRELGREAARSRRGWRAGSPAGFSCTPRELWQAHSLAVRVRDHTTFEPRPDVAPLLELVDEHERIRVGSPAPRVAGVSWIRPELVAQIAFAEWTADGQLRQPVFLGLRHDKKPSACTWSAREL